MVAFNRVKLSDGFFDGKIRRRTMAVSVVLASGRAPRTLSRDYPLSR
jgi:hypothetical protein